MGAISVKLPVRRDRTFGYKMNDNYLDVVKQNLKMLILTAQGERIMEPFFGVGLKQFLFENPDEETVESEISSKIQEQVEEYMPFIDVGGVAVEYVEESNSLSIRISYYIKPLALSDELTISHTM